MQVTGQNLNEFPDATTRKKNSVHNPGIIVRFIVTTDFHSFPSHFRVALQFILVHSMGNGRFHCNRLIIEELLDNNSMAAV